jgi:outer membrane biosynthesis protein TonB
MDVLHWRKAITASVGLHILLLAAAGYLMTGVKTPFKTQGKILLDMQLMSDSAEEAGNASGLPERTAASATETGEIDSAIGLQRPDACQNVNSVTPSETQRPDLRQPVVETTATASDKAVEATQNPGTFGEAQRPDLSEPVVETTTAVSDKAVEATRDPVTFGEAQKQDSSEPVAKNTAIASEKKAEAVPGSDTQVAGRRMDGSNTASGVKGSSGTGGAKLIGGNFVHNGDGTYTALSPEGIDYTIVRSVEANYPEEARAVGYARLIRVKAAILVGLDGKVESVLILSNVPNLGFREAVRKALMQWRFSPIYYRGINIKMKFFKNFYFEPS